MKRYFFQITGAVVAVVYLVVGILKSTNSTAAIGFLFIPVALAVGFFVGDAFKYILDLIQKKRPHSTQKTVLIAVFSVFCAYKYIQKHIEDKNIRVAKDPATPVAKLVELLQQNEAVITHEIASNPTLPQNKLEEIIKLNLTDYYIMSAAIQHPGLSVSMMEQVVALNRNDFKGDAEYEVYQTYVWAQLARRKDAPEDLIHRLADKKNPKHFLILALLESPVVSCGEKSNFLPQDNVVLEDAIRRSMLSQKCSP